MLKFLMFFHHGLFTSQVKCSTTLELFLLRHVPADFGEICFKITRSLII